MNRAAVLIGVSTSGNLPKLQAVESGIDLMREWAVGQGIAHERLVVLTDLDGKVRAHQVADAIETLVNRRDLDQLIVYFSGHGIHNRGDIWLLSDAPARSSEAVNVEGSIELARFCGISHVVFISDACRTAPEGIQSLAVDGIDIFPNDPVDGMERPVDVYFACARGRPALEVRDPVQAAREYSGVYTEILAEVLGGNHKTALELTQEKGVEVALVGTWKLADHMLAQVPARLKTKLGKLPSVNQTPVSRITSRSAWVSRLIAAHLPPEPDGTVPVLGGRARGDLNAVDAASLLLDDVLAGDASAITDGLLGGGHEPEPSGDAQLRSMAADLAAPPPPPSQHLTCGFRVRGAKVRAVHAGAARGTVLDGARASLVEVSGFPGAAATVLLELHDRAGVLIPAIPGYIAELTFRVDELVHISYEAADQVCAVYPDDTRVVKRALLASMAAASAMGVLRLTEEMAHKLSRLLAEDHMPDPALALYTAYACQDSGQRDVILQLGRHLQRGLGFAPCDIAVLSSHDSARPPPLVLPAVPMLSRGWALLKARHIELPPDLERLRNNLRPSFWTLFDAAGTRHLADAINQGRIYT